VSNVNPEKQARTETTEPVVGSHNAQYAVATGAQDIRDTIVIKQHDLFLLTDLNGNVPRENVNALGLYYQDTRFLSAYELVLEGIPPTYLLSTGERQFAEVQELTNPDLRLPSGAIVAKETITFHRERIITSMTGDEALSITNFNVSEVPLELAIYFDADFKDMFELRGFVTDFTRGVLHEPTWDGNCLYFQYDGLDGIVRKTTVHFDPLPENRNRGQVVYRILLPARSTQTLRLHLTVELSTVPAPPDATSRNLGALVEHGDEEYNRWARRQSRILSDNQSWNDLIDRSRKDIHLLQSGNPKESYPAAGIPWFATLFGRDSLITGYENIWDPSQSNTILRLLAHYQGTKVDDWRNEQPGKIMHELRRGELANCNIVPFNPYYGTVDATPLFVILLAEYYRWTADIDFVRQLEPNLRAALDWMENYGDLDGDGFLEYETTSASGLANQGWKDSWDAIMHRDGTLAKQPIALVEVQGYAYLARHCASELYQALGDDAEAQRQRYVANWLRSAFDSAFWLEDLGCYALALDGEKRPCAVISSNAGQTLWSGIVPPDKAAKVADRVMRSDMFTGWGIRTLGTGEIRYNPMGYHVGSVWPHDNAIIGLGLKRYGEEAKLQSLVTGFFESTRHFPDRRVPELFCGYDRAQFRVPVRYPVACSPQAWAAGASLLFCRTMLGLVPNAPADELLIVRPVLPEWLRSVTVEGLRVGESTIDLRYQRQGDHTFTEILRQTGSARIVFVQTWPGD